MLEFAFLLAAFGLGDDSGYCRLFRRSGGGPSKTPFNARLVGLAERPQLAFRYVDDRREQQATVLELLQTQELASELPTDADLPALPYAFELRSHDRVYSVLRGLSLFEDARQRGRDAPFLAALRLQTVRGHHSRSRASTSAKSCERAEFTPDP
jgi:hypothetical protein